MQPLVHAIVSTYIMQLWTFIYQIIIPLVLRHDYNYYPTNRHPTNMHSHGCIVYMYTIPLIDSYTNDVHKYTSLSSKSLLLIHQFRSW